MSQRSIDCQAITEHVARLCIEANYDLPDDVRAALVAAREAEPSPLGRHVLDQLLRNAQIADQGNYPLCQDTGLAVIWLELGQDARIVGGALYDAVQAGVRKGYREGYLRASIVAQPFSARVNSGDNTPAVIHLRLVPGDRLRIVVCPKGGGSENMSALGMLKPAEGRQGVIDFVRQTVERAGGNPCPPLIVGVGIGGSAEQAMLLAKHSLLRAVGEPSPDPEIAALESDMLRCVNASGIGPQGLGGQTTALAVHVQAQPCHIASLPVGVNLQCHSARHQEAVL